ncbi:MAG: hypothetical protein GXP31_17020 [Kiritimatiellaeota bacterium]|nr:hypothetical protein [Kiritimatiellota bacterium]
MKQALLRPRLPLCVAILCISAAAEPVTPTPSGQRAVMRLDGAWQTRANQGWNFDFPPGDDGWQNIEVPSRGGPFLKTFSVYDSDIRKLLDKQGRPIADKASAWYRRKFELPPGRRAGKRAVLQFEGLGFKSAVWLNGKLIGRSLQGMIRLDYDVTDALHDGKNELVVGLTNRTGLVDARNNVLLAPSRGGFAGIWGHVTLELVPDVHVDDVYVKTFVKARRIEFDITVTNARPLPVNVAPSVLITGKNGVPERLVEAPVVTIPAGAARVVRVRDDWVAPILWSPGTPALYFAYARIREKGAVVDEKRVRFGFREFEIRDKRFYLNGRRITLLRDSLLTPPGTDYANVAIGDPRSGGFRLTARRPCNTVRMHIGFINRNVMDWADELGVMIIPEFSPPAVASYPPEKKRLWLPAYIEYVKGIVRQYRNRPSVVIWNMTNETYWDRMPDHPEYKAVARELIGAVRELDAIRPLDGDGENGWDGLLSIVNVHYPESQAGPLRDEFPHSGLVVPNNFSWLKDKGENTGWRTRFVWDRPLIVGEYWSLGGSPTKWCAFAGEAAYDWEKWSRQDIKFGDGYPGNPFAEAVMILTDIYRRRGVAGLNPWYGNRALVMPQVAVRRVDFHPNFFGGETAARRVVLFNEGEHEYTYRTFLQCTLSTAARGTLWRERIPVVLKPGEVHEMDIPIQFPQVSAQVAATLKVRLMFWAAGGTHEKSRFEETVFILPRPSLADVDAGSIMLVDASGETAAALTELGLNLQRAASVTSAGLKNKRVVIVGEKTELSRFKNVLVRFAREGGRVIVLRQDKWYSLGSEFPEIDEKHICSRTWKRTYDHPILTGIDDRQLSWWRPDHLVAARALVKPANGRTRVLLDAGGVYGLEWMPLGETPCGKGTVLQSQLFLCDRVGVEPAAGLFLSRLVRYAVDYVPPPTAPLHVLAGANRDAVGLLRTCNIEIIPGLSGPSGPLFVDASADLSEADFAGIKELLAAGGRVWLHGFTPETANKAAKILPFKPTLREFDDKKIQALARRADAHILNGLSTADFFWTEVNLGARAGYFAEGKPLASIGRYELLLPTLQSGRRLTDPGVLTEIPVGRGSVLFDTLPWERALATRGPSVMRIVSAVAANLGARIRPRVEKSYRYFYLDLSQHANMGYYDETPDDGKGGWMDSGESDMCFFLVNHTGRRGGNGPPVPVDKFPTMNRFCGRPFRLIDPAKNHGHAIISLRGKDRRLKLPDRKTGIPVGRKADVFWFAHAAGWAPKGKDPTPVVARYVFHYADGSTVEFPVRWHKDISDWYHPSPVANAQVAWTGKNRVASPVGFYVTEWKNPHPDKVVASLDVIGALETTQIMLLGVTGGVEAGDEEIGSAGRPFAVWDPADYRDGVLPCREYPAAAFKPLKDSPSPQPARIGDAPALRFTGAEGLSASLESVDELAEIAPFALDVDLSPDATPDDYYGGVYQAMEYKKRGFRLVMNRGLKLDVHIFAGQGRSRTLRGKTVLSTRGQYHVSVRFDGDNAMLFVNGKLDAATRSPLPATYTGHAIVGSASGKGGYHFKGRIGRITLSRLGNE